MLSGQPYFTLKNMTTWKFWLECLLLQSRRFFNASRQGRILADTDWNPSLLFKKTLTKACSALGYWGRLSRLSKKPA